MRILLNINYNSNNKRLIKLTFNYPITRNIQISTEKPISLQTIISQFYIDKIYTIFTNNNEKICKIYLRFKVLNKYNDLQLEDLNIYWNGGYVRCQ